MKRFLLGSVVSLSLLCACNSKPDYASYDEYPVYEGTDLELVYSTQNSKFRVWAPTATAVKLLLYDKSNEGGAYETLDMDKDDDGTWTLEIDKNLKGKYYTFQAKINDRWMEETPGMNAKATGANGKRAAIIDFAETNPDGWENDKHPVLNNFADISLYELNINDFTNSASSGIKNKGKYLALTEKGKKNAAGKPCGLDYLKEMGISHVLLSACYDFADGDETRPNDIINNPNYDVLNFNVPEGRYSTDPKNPVKRILEFKQMVQALHKNDIRVMMDVDFSHTALCRNSYFNLLAPGYFYRMNADSTWSDALTKGNEIASERPMMRKLIIESLLYWATEYHVDGFRFKSMGLMDIETVNAVRAALDKIDPTLFVCGDDSGIGTSVLAPEKRALTINAKEFDNVAIFSNDISQILVGTELNPDILGFVYGTDSIEETVKFAAVGAIRHPQIDYSRLLYSKESYVNHPVQIINNVQLIKNQLVNDTLLGNGTPNASEKDLIRYNKLAQTIVFTSQGIPLTKAGDEQFSTENNATSINTTIADTSKNDIGVKKEFSDYYKALIQLRKAHAAFRLPTREMVQQHLKFLDIETSNVVGFMLTDHVNGEEWKNILVIYNGNKKIVSARIPAGEWNVVCHDGEINKNGITTVNDTVFRVAPTSASILYMK